MKRYNAINAVVDAIKKDNLATTIFLKGSIARGEDDDYSDVDLYAVVEEERFEAFLAKRIEYLESYLPLINWVEVNFVGPQIVGIFADALHFDFYVVKPDAIPQTGAIKIIVDEAGLLNDYQNEPLTLSEEQLSKIVSEFIYMFIEIEATYSRGDLLRCVTLFHMNNGHLGLLTRYVYDPTSAILGNKNMFNKIPATLREAHLEMLELATPSNIITATKMLMNLFEDIVQKLPTKVQNEMNKPYYQLLKQRIYDLD